MPHLLQLTLGNPRQACRQFGICRIELWDGTPPGEQQCIARAEVKQAQLSLLFLADYLRPPLRQGHFDPCFLVEAPCRLPAFIALPGPAILPGRYAVTPAGEALQLSLKLGEVYEHPLPGIRP